MRRAQLQVVLDDAVVDHGDLTRDVRMRVLLRDTPVRGPAGVADAEHTLHGRLEQNLLEVLQFPDRAHHLDALAVVHRQPGRVITAVLEPSQSVDQDRRRVLVSDVANDAAHGTFSYLASLGGSGFGGF